MRRLCATSGTHGNPASTAAGNPRHPSVHGSLATASARPSIGLEGARVPTGVSSSVDIRSGNVHRKFVCAGPLYGWNNTRRKEEGPAPGPRKTPLVSHNAHFDPQIHHFARLLPISLPDQGLQHPHTRPSHFVDVDGLCGVRLRPQPSLT